MPAYSLDQFRVFVAVVDHGGFAAAARKLDRAQSAITYAIRCLEDQCGLVLLDRSHYRPSLTDAGRALLPRARRLLSELDDFDRHAGDFARGVEANLSLVINEFADPILLQKALAAMHAAFPSVQVRMTRQPFGQDLEMIRSGVANLGLVAGVSSLGTEFAARHLLEQELVAVAAPSHPLSALAGPIELPQLRGHMQIVWTRALTPSDAPDFGVHALDAWHVTDLDLKHRLLRAGVGWGSLPRHLVEADLQAGALRELNLHRWEGRDRMPRFPVFLVYLEKAMLGPAARFFIDELTKHAAHSLDPQ